MRSERRVYSSGVVLKDGETMAVILAVEDETPVRIYLTEILKDAGHTVIEAENADRAVAILEARRDIEIIVTDVNMPGSMDGMRLAAVIRDRWPPIKVIVTSGAGRISTDQLPSGCRFLPKPYSARPVLAAIEAAAA
jgi:two-component system, response regulator PdtaR